ERGSELAIPARQSFGLLKSNLGGRIGYVTISRRKVVARHGQTQKPFWMRECVIGSNATAGGRSDRVEFLYSQEFDQLMQILRSDSRIFLWRQVGVIIVPARIGDDAIAGIGECGLLVQPDQRAT